MGNLGVGMCKLVLDVLLVGHLIIILLAKSVVMLTLTLTLSCIHLGLMSFNDAMSLRYFCADGRSRVLTDAHHLLWPSLIEQLL